MEKTHDIQVYVTAVKKKILDNLGKKNITSVIGTCVVDGVLLTKISYKTYG